VGRGKAAPSAFNSLTPPLPPILYITNGESPRTAGFVRAVQERCGKPPVIILWHQLLQGDEFWKTQLQDGAWIRIDSPGKNWLVEHALLQRGANVLDELDPDATKWKRLSAAQTAVLPFEVGRIHPSRQWFLGFREAMREVVSPCAALATHWFQPSHDILTMFDKARCSARLSTAGCSVPKMLGLPSSFDELMSLMDAHKRQRIFLKLCHGSSASGALALERSGASMQGFSTTRMVGSPEGVKLYNDRKVIRYDSLPDLRQLVDALGAQRAMAEAWIPKAGLQQHRFDVRVVVINGMARHVVARLSRTPFTNLQLGSTRLDAETLRQHLGNTAYDKILHAAEDAMRAFPKSLFAGVDVTLDSSLRRACVLEVNAFGDLLPGLLHEGRDTYSWEVAEMLRQKP